MVTDGGEVAFVGRMVEDSMRLREEIRWYTSMVSACTPRSPVHLHSAKQTARARSRSEEGIKCVSAAWGEQSPFIAAEMPQHMGEALGVDVTRQQRDAFMRSVEMDRMDDVTEDRFQARERPPRNHPCPPSPCVRPPFALNEAAPPHCLVTHAPAPAVPKHGACRSSSAGSS